MIVKEPQEFKSPVNSWDTPAPDASFPATPITTKPSESESFCRIPRFTMTSGIWAGLSPSEGKVFAAICHFANRKRGYRAWPRMKTLAKMAGVHLETVRIAKKELKKKGLINFGYAPDLGPGSFIWLAITKPFHFSDDCKRHLTESAHAS